MPAPTAGKSSETPGNASPDTTTQTQNVGDGSFYGAEMAIDASVNEKLTVGANYTVISRKIKDALQPSLRPTGVRIPLRNERIWRKYCRMVAADMLLQREGESSLPRHRCAFCTLLRFRHIQSLSFLVSRSAFNKDCLSNSELQKPGSFLPHLPKRF